MPSRSFRFLHSSDLHLEQPVGGFAEISDTLRQLLIDAPYRAAEKLFDAAIHEHVEFVVLAGDVVHATQAGPRALLFLSEQFERLGQHGIAIYWCGGSIDALEQWPQAMRLPDNVYRFATDRVTVFAHRHGEEAVAQLIGAGSSEIRRLRPTTDFVREHTGLYAIGVAYGQADADALSKSQLQYWALGGEHRRRTLSSGAVIAQYSGSPQARSFAEPGASSATLVHVDDAGQTRTSQVATDVLRMSNERLAAPDGANRETIERLVLERAQAIRPGELGADLIVNWRVACRAASATALQRKSWAAELLARLRSEFGQRRPGLWSAAMTLEHDGDLPEEQYTQETLLGEFLRAVRRHEAEPHLPLPLESFLSPRDAASELAAATAIRDPVARAELLRDVALLGSKLLSGEETPA